MIRDQMLT